MEAIRAPRGGPEGAFGHRAPVAHPRRPQDRSAESGATTIDHVAETSRVLSPEAKTARRTSRLLLLAGSLLLLGVVGWIDYITGIELHVFPLYFLLLTLVSLRLGRIASLAFTLLCAATWLVSNTLAGMISVRPLLTLANTAIMLVAFVMVAFLAGSAQRSLERERILSRTDGLSGLPNGRGFYEAAAAEFERAARYRHPLTLAYLDIDDFKRVNDRLGHSRGDELLVNVARLLRRACRASDVIGRLGGDEFVILYPETGRPAALAALENLRASLAEAAGPPDGQRLTVSIGAVSFATPPADVEAAVRQADALMYEVKVSGKNGLRSVESTEAPSLPRRDA
jgi:diguanylate cyclase (GGDEF)-like protein